MKEMILLHFVKFFPLEVVNFAEVAGGDMSF